MTHGDTTVGDTTTTPGDTTGDPTDTAEGPTDATSTEDTSVEPDITDPDTTQTCTALPFEGELPGFTSSAASTWQSPTTNLGLGGGSPDIATLVFKSNAVGSFSLDGERPTACTRCFSFTIDVGSGATKTFFANGGTIIVNQNPSQDLDVSVSDVTLVEVTSGGTIVAGGDCLTIADVTLLGTVETCVPDCEGKACGDDGCGDDCGTCPGTQSCNASGQCVGGTTGCTTLALDPTIQVIQPGAFVDEVTAAGLGGADPDYFQIEFYDPATGTFDLGSATNANYATCLQCVRVFEDQAADLPVRQYLQTKGTLVVAGTSDVQSDPPTLQATLTNVELHEVTIADDGTFTSTLVPNGKCIKVTNRSISTP
ncbi:MAG: hypothetical protein U1F43_14505 [Myxococcota bacterium]